MSDRTCSYEGCSKPYYGKGYCQTHYRYKRRADGLDNPKPPRSEISAEKKELFEKGFQKCQSCRLTLPIESFNRDKKQTFGYELRCRSCRSKKRYKFSLGVDEGDGYRVPSNRCKCYMPLNAEGKCDICDWEIGLSSRQKDRVFAAHIENYITLFKCVRDPSQLAYVGRNAQSMTQEVELS